MGLIRFGNITQFTLDNAINNLKDHETIIIDFRKFSGDIFPHDINKYFANENGDYLNYYVTNQNEIGTFVRAGMHRIIKSKDSYKGKLIILINENVQSATETFNLMFKAMKNTTFVGCSTAGTNGDITKISMPGGYTFRMSSAGIFYPNGKQFQRIGIIPKYIVIPTIAGIINNKDEILEFAIGLANDN